METFSDVLSESLGDTNTVVMTIDVGNSTPLAQRTYQVPPTLQKRVQCEIDKLLQLGVAEFSTSIWCSLIAPVIKTDRLVRVCID